MKEYIKVKENAGKFTDIKIETYYSLGGMNYFTGKSEGRGYYVSVTPVERTGYSEIYTGFSGIKQLVKAASRKSKKAEAEAEVLADKVKEELIKYICEKHNLEIVKEDEV